MTKQIYLCLLGLTAILQCPAQPGNKTHPWVYGVYVQASRHQVKDGFLSIPYSAINNTRNAFASGLTFRYPLSHRFVLSTGIGLSYKRVKTMAPFIVDTTHPNYTPPRPWEWEYRPPEQTPLSSFADVIEIDIPVTAQYYAIRDKFYLSAGLQFTKGLYMTQRALYQNYRNELTRIHTGKWGEGYQLMLPLACGMDFHLGQKHTLSVSPGISVLLDSRKSYVDYYGLYTLRTSFYF